MELRAQASSALSCIGAALSLILMASVACGGGSIPKGLHVDPEASKLAGMDLPEGTGEPLLYRHEEVTMTLPPGWVEKPRGRNFEDEVIGWFQHKPSGCLMYL